MQVLSLLAADEATAFLKSGSKDKKNDEKKNDEKKNDFVSFDKIVDEKRIRFFYKNILLDL